MYKCIHCNEIISKDQFEGRIVKAGPKLYCVKCGEPIVEIPDASSVGASFHGTHATLISNSDNRITTNNYYGSGAPEEQIETPYGSCRKSEARLCKQCRKWVPLVYFNQEKSICYDCELKEALESFEEGKNFFDMGFYEDAIQYFKKYESLCPKEKLAKVKTYIGRCYYELKDYKSALKYFVITSKDSAESSYYLGVCYYNGHGVEKDCIKAARLFLESNKKEGPMIAEKCGYDNYYYLGVCYFYGYGVSKDYTMAMNYLREANNNANKKTMKFLDDLE